MNRLIDGECEVELTYCKKYDLSLKPILIGQCWDGDEPYYAVDASAYRLYPDVMEFVSEMALTRFLMEASANFQSLNSHKIPAFIVWVTGGEPMKISRFKWERVNDTWVGCPNSMRSEINVKNVKIY